MADILFHVGLPKTGTTYIQESLSFNRDLLSTYSIRYHQIGTAKCTCHWWFATSFFEHLTDYAPVRTALKNGSSIEELTTIGDESVSAFKDELSHYDSVILSAEQFFFLPKLVLSRIKDFFSECGAKVKVVVYLRDFYELAISELNQKVKMGMGRLNDLVESLPTFNVKDNLENYVNVFGKESIEIRDFSRLTSNNVDLAFDLLNALTNSPIQLAKANSVSNLSLSGTALQIIDLINNDGFDAPAHSKIRDRLIESLCLLNGHKLSPSKSTIESFYRKIEPDLLYLSNTFGFEFEHKPNSYSNHSSQVNNTLSVEEVAKVIANLLREFDV